MSEDLVTRLRKWPWFGSVGATELIREAADRIELLEGLYADEKEVYRLSVAKENDLQAKVEALERERDAQDERIRQYARRIQQAEPEVVRLTRERDEAQRCDKCDQPQTLAGDRVVRCPTCEAELEAEVARLTQEVHDLLWNLAGCNTYADGYDIDGEPSAELSRPALLAVRRLALRNRENESALAEARGLLARCVEPVKLALTYIDGRLADEDWNRMQTLLADIRTALEGK